MKRMVPRPCSPSSRRASSMACADVGHPGVHRRQGHEGLGRGRRHHRGQRGLAGARRSPQDGRGEPVLLDQDPQRCVRAPPGGAGRRCRRASAAAAGRPAGPLAAAGRSAAAANRSGAVAPARRADGRHAAVRRPVVRPGLSRLGAWPQAELAQHRVGQRLGRAGHGVGPRLGLREGDHLADVLLAGQEGDEPVDAHGEAAVGRGAVAERAEAGTRSGPRPPPA